MNRKAERKLSLIISNLCEISYTLTDIEEVAKAAQGLLDETANGIRALKRELVEDEKEVTEQCPDCGNEVCLKWSIGSSADFTIYCPYCGYRMKLCSMCDARDGAVCDWDSKTGKCKHDEEKI